MYDSATVLSYAKPVTCLCRKHWLLFVLYDSRRNAFSDLIGSSIFRQYICGHRQVKRFSTEFVKSKKEDPEPNSNTRFLWTYKIELSPHRQEKNRLLMQSILFAVKLHGRREL